MFQILVIEDEDLVRENILDLLIAEGYDPIPARDGEEGVHLAWDRKPDLIICDILLPRLDGYGVLAKLSRDPVTASIPFLFLTALGSPEEIRKGMGLGGDDYITKPFELVDLLTALEVRLGKKQTLSQQAYRTKTAERDQINIALPVALKASLFEIYNLSANLVMAAANQPGSEFSPYARQIKDLSEKSLRLVKNVIFLANLVSHLHEPTQVRTYQQVVTPFADELIREIGQAVTFQYGRNEGLILDLEKADLQVSYEHLLKLMEEILDFALHYAPSGESIQVSGRISGNHNNYLLRCEFNFNPKDVLFMQKLADPMPQLEVEADQFEVRISLMILRRLVEFYRGDIKFTNQPNHEMKIAITLPLAKDVTPKV